MYGGHLAQHVIDNIIAPKSESKDLVMQWLEGEGLRDIATLSPRLDSVIVEGSIKQIEKLLKTEYSTFSKSNFQSLRLSLLIAAFWG